MDFDNLLESARIARLAGNVDHETDRKKKIAVALALGRIDWLSHHGVNMRHAIVMLGENDVRIVAAAKTVLQAELN
jgi:hypothetical protein